MLRRKQILNSAIIAGISVFLTLPSNAKTAVNCQIEKCDLTKAISLRKSGQYLEAVALLKLLHTNEQTSKRVNIELIYNYIKLKKINEAKRLVSTLTGQQLTATERKKVNLMAKLIDKSLAKQLSEHHFSGDIILYAGIDSMTSQFPVYEYIDYFDWDELVEFDEFDDELFIGRSEEAERDRENYLAQRLKASYQYRPREPITWSGSEVRWQWHNDVSFYHKQSDSEEDQRYQRLKLQSTLYFISELQWLTEFALASDHYWLGSDQALASYQAKAELSIPYADHWLKLGIEASRKSYHHSNQENDARVSTPWLEYGYQFSPLLKWSVGVRYRQNRAVDAFYSFDNTNLYTSWHTQLTEKLSGFLSLNYHQLHYVIDDPELVNWGKERKHSIAAGLEYSATARLNIGINGHYVTNELNRDSGQDDWNRIELFLRYQF